ncbi:cell division protein FtsL [Companilactobacillus halodurans]|uniref:Cell division protein FtsL n=1 Tax=Companilactobacillus halodurans TaxID=2584183 RepID=A0A5P0ZL58_9LACO|nr:cell division protein FtsL [Companilactobacillus halodurans]MQS74953.1 cell division protein FtsL [Companilactobacillus halodurans]MQS97176.1 cell division protein FtsL [Companilactobacillus halodurans]
MREENTARNLQDYQVAQEPEVQVQATPKKHSVSLSKFEAFSIVGLALLTLALMVTLVSMKVSMTSSQNKLDSLTTQISKTNTSNVNLRQEISELTSFDRFSSFAKKHNLKMSDNNVRNISK